MQRKSQCGRQGLLLLAFLLLRTLAWADFDYVISGGGPVGLTTAIALLQQGRSVLVVEKRDPSETWGTRHRTLAFNDKSRDYLVSLGISPSVFSYTEQYRFFRERQNGQEISSFDVKYGALFRTLTSLLYRHSPGYLADISDLEKALFTRYQEIGGEIIFNHEITALAGRQLVVEDKAGHKRVVEYGNLVNAEGTHSRLNTLINAPRVIDEAWDGFFIRGNFIGQGRPEVRISLHPGGTKDFFYSLFYSKDKIFSLGIDLHGHSGVNPSAIEAMKYLAGVGVAADQVENVVLEPIRIEQSYLSEFYFPKQRLLVVGDAAHTVNTFLGIGVNFGIQEARLVADYARHGDITAFEKGMRKNINFMQKMNRRYYRYLDYLVLGHGRAHDTFYRTLSGASQCFRRLSGK